MQATVACPFIRPSFRVYTAQTPTPNRPPPLDAHKFGHKTNEPLHFYTLSPELTLNVRSIEQNYTICIVNFRLPFGIFEKLKVHGCCVYRYRLTIIPANKQANVSF